MEFFTVDETVFGGICGFVGSHEDGFVFGVVGVELDDGAVDLSQGEDAIAVVIEGFPGLSGK